MSIPRRPVAAVAALVVALALTGCVRHGPEIADSARAALDDAGLPAGAEAFNTSEGLGDSWDLLVCVEDRHDSSDEHRARLIAGVLEAVRPVADRYASHLHDVRVRVVDADVDPTSLDAWCRADDDYLLDVRDAADLLAGVTTGWDDVGIEVPYDEVRGP